MFRSSLVLQKNSSKNLRLSFTKILQRNPRQPITKRTRFRIPLLFGKNSSFLLVPLSFRNIPKKNIVLGSLYSSEKFLKKSKLVLQKNSQKNRRLMILSSYLKKSIFQRSICPSEKSILWSFKNLRFPLSFRKILSFGVNCPSETFLKKIQYLRLLYRSENFFKDSMVQSSFVLQKILQNIHAFAVLRS